MAYTPFPGDAVVSGTPVSKSKFGDIVVANLNDHESRLATTESGKVPTSRLISTGTGLTGGGNLSADRTISANFGTSAGTIAQGNDARITITQDGTVGNTALGNRVSALEGVTGIGDWTKTNTQTLGNATNDKILFSQANVTAVGISKADSGSGATDFSTFTISQAGLWLVTFDCRFAGTIGNVSKYIMIGDDTGVFYAKTSNFANGGSQAANLGISLTRSLAVGAKLCAYAYVEGAGGTVIREGTTLITRFTATRIR